MNIGIDIDETITAIPAFFSLMTSSLRKQGHKVFIVTFRHKATRQETKKQLKEMGIEYDTLIMGEHVMDPPWKAKQCVKHKLDVFFDDSIEVIDAIKFACPQTKAFHVRGWY